MAKRGADSKHLALRMLLGLSFFEDQLLLYQLLTKFSNTMPVKLSKAHTKMYSSVPCQIKTKAKQQKDAPSLASP